MVLHAKGNADYVKTGDTTLLAFCETVYIIDTTLLTFCETVYIIDTTLLTFCEEVSPLGESVPRSV